MSQHMTVTEVAGQGTALPIKVSRVERFEEQPRKTFNKTKLASLAENIQEAGQLQPILVFKHPQKPGHFILKDGERRLRAFKLIWEKTGVEPTIDAIVNACPESFREHFRASMLANLFREDITDLEEAAAYHRFVNELGMTVTEVAKMVDCSRSFVNNYIKMHGLPDEVKVLMDTERPKEQRLTTSAAIEITRIKDPVLQCAVAKESVERQMGIQEVRTYVRVKTGQSGYGIGGRMRKPSDDYKTWTSFLGRTVKAAQRFKRDLSIRELYFTRDDEDKDRRVDANLLKEIIHNLEQLLIEVENKE